MKLSCWLVALSLFGSTAVHAADDSLVAKVDALYRVYADELRGIPEVSATQLQKEFDQVILVDVREAKERAVSLLPNAIDQETYQRQLAAKKIQKPVVFYCTVGYRSGLATREAIERGIDARNLSAGILSWVAHGGKVVDAEQHATQRVHVYGRQWAELPADFEAVY